MYSPDGTNVSVVQTVGSLGRKLRGNVSAFDEDHCDNDGETCVVDLGHKSSVAVLRQQPSFSVGGSTVIYLLTYFILLDGSLF